MEKSVSASMSMSTPEDEVDLLMQQVADEHGLEIKGGVSGVLVPQKKAVPASAATAVVDDDDALMRRLAALKK